MARFTMLTEQDRDQLMKEIYDLPFKGLSHFEGMMDVLKIMDLLDDWNEYVDRRENYPELFK